MTDDLIRRQDAIMVVKDQRLEAIGCIPESYNAGVDASASVLEMIPSAQRKGKWIDIDEQSYTWKVRCSVCGHERSMMSTQGEYPKYCEECGARMAEE